MTVIGAAGFYGYTLTNVLFLTGVWRYSVLQAGLALTPRPGSSPVAVAGPTSRLAQRIGPRPVLVAGGPGVGRGGAVVRRAGRGHARLRRRVAAGHGPARDRRRHAVPEPQRGRGRLGAGRELRDRDRDELGRTPGRSGARRRACRGDHRHAVAADGLCGVSQCLDVRCGLPVRGRAWLPVCRARSARCRQARTPRRCCGGDAARAVLAATERSRGCPHAAPLARSRGAAIRRSDAAGSPGARPARGVGRRVPCRTCRSFPAWSRSCGEQLAARAVRTTWTPASGCSASATPAHAMYVVRAGRLEVVDEAPARCSASYRRGRRARRACAADRFAASSASVRAARSTERSCADRPRPISMTSCSSSPAAVAGAKPILSRSSCESARAAPTSARPRPTTVALIALDWRIAAGSGSPRGWATP